MKQVKKFFFEKTIADCLDNVYEFTDSAIALLEEQRMWDDFYGCGRIKKGNVTVLIAIGGHHAAGYFKTDGQNYCVSSFYIKEEKCYTGRVLLGYSQKDVIANVKAMYNDIVDFDTTTYDEKYIACANHQKAKSEVTESVEIKRKEQEIAKAAAEEKIKSDPENELLFRILEVAKRKRDNCYCTESQRKFQEIIQLIADAKPAVVAKFETI
ncbi:MAG: hypothetical protein WC979_00400 [Candidatus Pacearchaeota archaeon]|jgi:hypothetical protein|nr:hypothetical protein [Clostridia bacterium]